MDLSKCTGCGECAKVCPVEVLSEYDEGLISHKAVFKRYAQAIPGAFTIEKRGTSPCKAACPAHISVQGYVALAAQGKFREALKLIKEENPFPAVCGRVCHHPCESTCKRGDLDEPVAINPIKRFIADLDLKEATRYVPACKEAKAKKAAVIGSGPAGLSCAYFLAREGYPVTVFEQLPVAGGMLVAGIPEYRLPRDIIEAEIRIIRDMGVDIRTGVRIGRDITIAELRRQGYNAFFVAVGSHECKDLGLEGETLAGVVPGLEYLRNANLGKPVFLGKRVAVIGGGNVAMDVVRTARRMGSEEAFVVYRRSRDEMPANPEEIEECEEEGIPVRTLLQPVRILGEDGRVTALEVIRMELGEPDAGGRRKPIPIPGSEFTIPVDAVVPAIGQETDWACLTPECACTLTNWGAMQVDPLTLQTSDPDIFAGGDAVTGPATVVEAIAAGKEAARSIDRFLQGLNLREGREKEWKAVEDVPQDAYDASPRVRIPRIEPEKRRGNFREVQQTLTEEAIVREARRCLNCGICSECYQCVEACLAGAVVHEQPAVERDVRVGSVILCPGGEAFDPSPLEDFYHYRGNADVVTSLEFERLLSASGPTMGHLVRPSDGKEPKKIAWLQCVGSRDVNRCKNGYCSAVCCMYAVKEAMIAKEHAHGDLDCAIFNMDIRSFGKDYEKYYLRARDKAGVRFVKARIHTIQEIPATGSLGVEYVDDSGAFYGEEFDMIVLSVGLQISGATVETAERLGVALNKHHFVDGSPFAPVETSRPGVFACGVFQGPKDIPSSVIEASAASCAAGILLSESRGACIKQVAKPPELDVTGLTPRIGVFVCNCGVNIAGVIDVPELQRYAATLPNVVYSGQNLFTCSQDSQEQMKQLIAEHRLNRVVVASCSPKTHEAIFMDTLEACGLNRYLFDMANIRNQDSWIHSERPQEATEKAKELVRMSVARASVLVPLNEKKITVNKRALVVGGGVAGMNAAMSIADQGFEVVLIEKESRLGGLAGKLHATIDGYDVRAYVDHLIQGVTANPRIQVLTGSLIVGFSGFKGNFTTEVLVGPGMYERKIEHGVAVIATGAKEYRPVEYGYGQDPRIVTQLQMADRLEREGADRLKNVVMIQCVGSRNETNPNCSRVCCQTAVKNALHIKKLNPQTEVRILYRDIRTYGVMEEYYTEARKLGVIFHRFEPEVPPVVESTPEGVMVAFTDHVLNRPLRACADVLVLSAGVEAEDTAELASIMKLARNAEGFFLEAHVKLRPVDMAAEGVFVCGTAHSPKLVSEAIAQALASASRAMTLLSQDFLTLSAVTARVTEERCAACLICLRACPRGVPRINREGASEIDRALCRGCGICAAECPAKAIELDWYEDVQILREVDALLEDVA